jgi:hypothetical protein
MQVFTSLSNICSRAFYPTDSSKPVNQLEVDHDIFVVKEAIFNILRLFSSGIVDTLRSRMETENDAKFELALASMPIPTDEKKITLGHVQYGDVIIEEVTGSDLQNLKDKSLTEAIKQAPFIRENLQELMPQVDVSTLDGSRTLRDIEQTYSPLVPITAYSITRDGQSYVGVGKNIADLQKSVAARIFNNQGTYAPLYGSENIDFLRVKVLHQINVHTAIQHIPEHEIKAVYEHCLLRIGTPKFDENDLKIFYFCNPGTEESKATLKDFQTMDKTKIEEKTKLQSTSPVKKTYVDIYPAEKKLIVLKHKEQFSLVPTAENLPFYHRLPG